MSDSTVGELEIGPDLPGSHSHWEKFMAKPNKRVFIWHKIAPAEKVNTARNCLRSSGLSGQRCSN